jgi:RNA polymerase sigma factor (sigma-70 family)
VTDSNRSLEHLASLAIAGDRDALSDLLAALQDPVYRHALKFLGHRADAEDATQEILIRITTRLSTFEGRSKITTWAYTIATRILMRTNRGRVEIAVGTVEDYQSFLDSNLDDHDFVAEEAEYRQLCEEVRISCTYGMLLCLTRPVRAAYLLGDILGIGDTDGAEICECSPAAFRQRLARGRRSLRSIIDNRCGLVDPTNPCSCGREVAGSLQAGIMQREQLTLHQHPRSQHNPLVDPDRFDRAADQIEHIVRIGELYKRDRFAAPAEVWAAISSVIPDLVETDFTIV